MMTPEELERRRHFITATDTPKILGVYPPGWGNAADVFLEKTAGLTTFEGNAATDAGTILEPSVAAWAATQLGPLRDGGWYVAENGVNAATLDVETPDGEPVECKTSGIVGPGTPHQWGQEWTDEIPDYYIVQVHAQMLVKSAKRAFVPALIGGRGFVMFQVLRNDALCDLIAETSMQFMERVKANEPPEDDICASLETLKRLKRQPNKTVPVSVDTVLRYTSAQAIKAEAERNYKAAQAALIAELGDAECGEFSCGQVTYFEQTRKAHFVEESTFRVLRPKLKKPKVIQTIEERQNRVEMIDNRLSQLGYLLKDESESGSRYYCAIGKPDVRLSDHEANEATASWMNRSGVIDLRIWNTDFSLLETCNVDR